jgi:cation transport regulator ChaC
VIGAEPSQLAVLRKRAGRSWLQQSVFRTLKEQPGLGLTLSKSTLKKLGEKILWAGERCVGFGLRASSERT